MRMLSLLIGLLLLLSGGLYWLIPHLLHAAYWVSFVFLASLTLLTHSVLEKRTKASGEGFVIWFLGAMVIRLLLSIALVAVLFWTKIPFFTHFVVNFFVLYILFAGLEIYLLLANLPSNSQS
jgi:hypothetical protein